MCGIIGRLKRFPSHERLVHKFVDSLSHRGPDGCGIYSDDCIELGHRRLSIIDLSQNAKQPMQCENERFVIIYNGEVYNYLELKQELENEECDLKHKATQRWS